MGTASERNRVEGVALSVEAYDQIVSLGHWCGPAANIRRRFNIEAAMPFDWWITPFDSLMKVLDERFANLFREENIEIITAEGKAHATVRDNYYNLYYHHDFKRDVQDRVLPDIAAQAAVLREKYRFIVDRFISRCLGRRLAFIRIDMCRYMTDGVAGPSNALESPDEQIHMASALYQRLERMLQPQSMDIYIFSNLPRGKTVDMSKGRIIFEHLGERIGTSYFYDENHDAFFERNGIELRR
jgi:hypothetical protein